MMKKKIIAAAAAVLVLCAFIPIPRTYEDGTKSYNAIAYKAVKWNRPFYKNLMFTETSFYRFPHSLKSVDELWNGMAIDPAVSTFTASVVSVSGNGITVEAIEDENGLITAGETFDISLEGTESGKIENGETVEIEYVPEVSAEKDGKINKIVDVWPVTGKTVRTEEKTDSTETGKTEKSVTSPEKTEISLTSGFNVPETVPYQAASSDPFHYIRVSRTGNDENTCPYVRFAKSRTELNKFLSGSAESYIYDSFSTEISLLKEKYNDDFFRTKALVIVVTEESSGSHAYKSVDVDGSSGQITITREIPQVGTCDMAYWFIIAEVDRNNSIFESDPGNAGIVFDDIS